MLMPAKLLKKLQILSIHDLYQEKVVKFVHQQRSGKLPNIFSEYFSSKNESYNYPNTRNRNNLALPKIKTESAKKSLKYTGAKIWNQISILLNLKTDNSYNVCQKQLRKHMLSMY